MSLMLRDALTITEDTERPFSIRFVTYDESRNKGGSIIELSDCVRVGASHNRKDNDTVNVKRLDRPDHVYTIHAHLILNVNNQVVTV